MLGFIIRRTGTIFITFLGITVISFLLMHLAPGEPTEVQTQLNPKASAQAKEQLRKIYGLDKPLHVQYFNWIKRILVLDFGNSFSPDGRPVISKIGERLPITISLNLLAEILIFAIALPIGVLSATKQYSIFDKFTTLLVYVGFATPTFWLALLLMILFGVHLGWLPISGLTSFDYEGFTFAGKMLDRISHLILPVFVAAFGGLAGISRYMRQSMLEVVRQDYITTARAKGLPENKVIYKHALRNALLPVVTIMGLSVPGLIGGSVIFETIFAIPGMGQLFWMSVNSRDYTVIMGLVVLGSVLTLVGNMLADIMYAVVDPRVRIDDS